jgi:hypothetical protein
MLNLTDYTALQLALYASGAYLWVIAYVIYIRNGFKYKYVEMPAFAAAGNIGWEFCWALLFRTNLGELSRYAHFAWFGLDLAIFWLVLKYGKKQTDIPLLQRLWVPVMLFCAVASGAFYGSFVHQGFDVGSTIQSAYICQLPISFLYIPLMLRQKNLAAFSMWTAWTRTLGTGVIGVFAFMRYPDHPFLLTMAVIATLVDFVYIGLLVMRKRELAGRIDPLKTLSRADAQAVVSAAQ